MNRFIALAFLAVFAASPAFAAERPLPEVSGFTCAPDETVYTPDTLFEIIDGAADLFLQYGFVRMDMARYAGPGKVEVRLELYEHDSVAHAFGVYSQEVDPKQDFIPLGAEGYKGEGYLNFFTGRYYVKTMTDQRGAAAQAALETVARAAHAKLAQKDEWPAALKLLPAVDRAPHTEQFIARSFLGRPFLNGAWVAKFGAVAPIPQVFLIEARDAVEAVRLLGEFTASVPAGQTLAKPGESCSTTDAGFGPIDVRISGRYLVGTVGLAKPAAKEAVFAEVAWRIKEAR